MNILHVGRLTKVKGTDLLIESLGLLSKDTMDSISLKIIGTGPLSPLVAKAAESHSSVQWLGEMPHDRVPPYITNADMLIMPSRSEGVPISMLEAMASMVPVLCTSVGGIGYYFDERHFVKIAGTTAEAVAAAIESAVRERAAMAAKAAEAKALIDSRFSWDMVAKQYMKLYEEILS
jgi:glycosyltransferase involved in cell wall biosynthesis